MTPFAIMFARMMRLGRAATGGVIMMIAIANTGFFGLPLIAASGGEFSLTVAVMYDAIGTGILIWTFNPIVAAWFGRGEVEDAMTIRPQNWANFWMTSKRFNCRRYRWRGDVLFHCTLYCHFGTPHRLKSASVVKVQARIRRSLSGMSISIPKMMTSVVSGCAHASSAATEWA